MSKPVGIKGLGIRSGLFDARSDTGRMAELISSDYIAQSPRGLLGPARGTTADYVRRTEARRRYRALAVGQRVDNPPGYPLDIGPRIEAAPDNLYRYLADGTRLVPMWVPG
jgi:hypothetical protein